jgi:hypothetical protein
VAYQAILRRKLPSEALSEHREDVLTATVIGAVAYGPPEMAQDRLRSCAGMDAVSSERRGDIEALLADPGSAASTTPSRTCRGGPSAPASTTARSPSGTSPPLTSARGLD